jgi:purine-binding chemotaxis protein CheW
MKPNSNASENTTMNTAVHQPSAALEPTQYLTFMLGSEVFAISILQVKEIIEYHHLTEVPMMPPSVRGVINLRGAVVPVVDPLARFGRPSSPVGKKTCFVIVEVQSDEDRHVIGVIVDAVNEVLDIAATEIEPPPSFGTRLRGDFLKGMAKVNNRFVILLDVDQVLRLDEVGSHAPSQHADIPEPAIA